jgi:hypothetical protein
MNPYLYDPMRRHRLSPIQTARAGACISELLVEWVDVLVLLTHRLRPELSGMAAPGNKAAACCAPTCCA